MIKLEQTRRLTHECDRCHQTRERLLNEIEPPTLPPGWKNVVVSNNTTSWQRDLCEACHAHFLLWLVGG